MYADSFAAMHQQRIAKLQEIKGMSPVEFELFVGSLFERMGYAVKTTPKSGDEGVDLFIEKEGRTAIVQCKRYESQVGQPVIRDLYGVMMHNHADHSFLVTTGHFSVPAQTWAEGKFINLVDGIELCEWAGLVLPPPLPQSPPPISPSLLAMYRLPQKRRVKIKAWQAITAAMLLLYFLKIIFG